MVYSYNNTSKKPKYKYNISYLKFDFVIKTEKEKSENSIPLCVVGKTLLSNLSTKPLLLKHHTETENKSISFF